MSVFFFLSIFHIPTAYRITGKTIVVFVSVDGSVNGGSDRDFKEHYDDNNDDDDTRG